MQVLEIGVCAIDAHGLSIEIVKIFEINEHEKKLKFYFYKKKGSAFLLIIKLIEYY